MSLNAEDIKTGIKGFDEDLALFFNVCHNPEELSKIKSIAAKETIGPEEFFNTIPEGILRIVMTFSAEAAFRQLLTQVPLGVKPLI
jgi:hypothetical protein